MSISTSASSTPIAPPAPVRASGSSSPRRSSTTRRRSRCSRRSASLIIGVLSVGVLIAWIAAIVPLGMGLADGGNYALYSLLGATGEQGLFVTLLTRARSVTVAMLGLGMMGGLTILDRLFKRRIHQKIATMRAEAAAKPDAAAAATAP